jgi:high affinity Mn2+ porin
MASVLTPSALALAIAAALGNAAAAPLSPVELERQLQQLTTRMEKLERRNTALEDELRATRAQKDRGAVVTEIDQRVLVLEQQQQRIDQGLQSDRLSENESELSARLKALEMQSPGMLGAARKIGALDGITAGLSLTSVAQKINGASEQNSQLNYRADAYVSLPLTKMGDVEHKIFAQFRLGQGAGISNLSSYSKPNASAFQMQGGLRADDAVANLAQAWYQANLPLPLGGYKPHSRETLELGFGKMDPFVFFDQNAVAGDETRQFINSVFVHNPLLDAGGDIGVDANGFAPGLRLSYSNVTQKPQTWKLSAGLFGAGEKGANYQRSLAAPLVLLQAETEQRILGGLAGNYRIYAWSNPQATHFDAAQSAAERHSGVGLSLDQRVGDGLTLFARYGQQLEGHVKFNRALTLGSEINGSYWSRGADSVGLAAAWLNSSADYRHFGRAANEPARGTEGVAELYYRWRFSKQFELSPHFQYIAHPGGDSQAAALALWGLRAQLNY